jgi:hypothetical protein
MPTYQPCPDDVKAIAAELLNEFETHHPLRDAKPKIDLVFAYASLDSNGETKNGAVAISFRGHRALGLCRATSLLERAKGNGDAEIILDGDWWKNADREEQRALLDHELHHLAVQFDRHGHLKKDDLDRPVLAMRKHDVEFGWFTVVAARHGEHSVERRQAKLIFDDHGQYLWPELLALTTPKTKAA